MRCIAFAFVCVAALGGLATPATARPEAAPQVVAIASGFSQDMIPGAGSRRKTTTNAAPTSHSAGRYVVPYGFVVHTVRTWTTRYRRRGIPIRHSCRRLSGGRLYICRLTSSARPGYIDLHITRLSKCAASVLALDNGKRVMSLLEARLGDFIPSCRPGHRRGPGHGRGRGHLAPTG
jgi:hypothetical protein